MSDGSEFIVHCPMCGHTWTAAYLPMPVDTFVKVGKAARCPKGCDARPFCGPAPTPAAVAVPSPALTTDRVGMGNEE